MSATAQQPLITALHYLVENLVGVACFVVVVMVAMLWFLIPGGASAKESDLFLRGL